MDKEENGQKSFSLKVSLFQNNYVQEIPPNSKKLICHLRKRHLSSLVSQNYLENLILSSNIGTKFAHFNPFFFVEKISSL